MTTDMKPFNRETEKAYAVGRVSFNIDQRRTRFDTHAAAIMEARPHMFVHFIPFGQDMFLFVNQDNTGYQLTRTAKRSGLSLNNAIFVRWFFAQQQIRKKTVQYSIVKTPKKYNGNTLYQLIPVI